MKKLIPLSLFAIIIIALPLFTGCGGRGRSSDAIRCFMFESERGGLAGSAIGGNIFVKTFKIARPFDSCSFVYKKAINDYESDYYNRFITSPEILITQQCRNWLERSGIFRNVLNGSSAASADYILEGNVISLYGDFAQEGQAFAIMQVRFFLIKETDGKAVIVFSNDYEEKIEVSATRPEDVVGGYDKCLENILSSFEKDLGSLNL